ncbi:cysteine-rich CWC family protein [Vibrio caribbeanicus]
MINLKTPCIAACKNTDGLCSGCYRTVDEIVRWSSMDNNQRDEVMAMLTGEHTTHTCPSCNQASFCDIKRGEAHCWCFSIDKKAIPEHLKNGECLCRKCLSQLANE